MRILKRLVVLGCALAVCALPLSALDFMDARIADRLVKQGENFDYVHKFGTNDTITTSTDPEAIWVVGGLPTFPTVAAATTIVSAGTDDAAAGTGARTVTIQGLDGSWDMQQQTVTMTGTDAVTLTDTYLRVFRAWVVTAGSGGTNADILTVAIGATTVAAIAAAAGQTQQAIYTIPNDYTEAWLMNVNAWVQRGVSARSVIMRLMTRVDGGAWRVREEWELNTTGTSSDGPDYPYWLRLEPKTDIVVRAQTVSANDTGVSAVFDIALRH